MKINIDEVLVKVKVTDGKLKAIISLDFGDISIKGFRLQTSEHENDFGEKLWLIPPSYKGPYKWHPIFFMQDKALWKELEKKIYDEYHKQSKEYHKKVYEVEDLPRINKVSISEEATEDPIGVNW
jgi:DNA-binding cell septation regulator SpoVG